MTRAALRLAVVPPVSSLPHARSPDDHDGSSPWAISALAVAAVHAGALAAAVLWQPTPPPTAPTPAAAAMTIDLAPMAAPSAPSRPAPPAHAREARQPTASTAAPPPRPETPKAEIRQPRPKVVAQPAQNAPPVKPQEATPAASAAAEPPGAAAQASAPASIAAPIPPSTALPTWQGALRGHLERHKRYPAQAQVRRQEGVALVRFAMGRDGTVHWARLERASGVARLDDEALALLERAQPLPPPPPEVAGDPIEIVVPIQFFLK